MKILIRSFFICGHNQHHSFLMSCRLHFRCPERAELHSSWFFRLIISLSFPSTVSTIGLFEVEKPTFHPLQTQFLYTAQISSPNIASTPFVQERKMGAELHSMVSLFLSLHDDLLHVHLVISGAGVC